MDAETAIMDGFARMPYRSGSAPEDFSGPLIANYGSKQDLERKRRAAGTKAALSGP